MPPHTGIDLSSNDYLGLARSQELHTQISQAYDERKIKRNGSTGSRLLTGNSHLSIETEQLLAHIFQSEATLLFGSGYTANLAVLSALPQRGDTIIYDEHSHASIKDGARLSLASRWSFAHNDMDDLRAKLKNAPGHKWVVVESLYSMDGSYCPIKEVCAIAKEFGAYTVVDEAHATGAIGQRGGGLAEFTEVTDQIDLRIYTFGKAMGIHGACVAGSAKVIHYLVNFSRPFIYTTAPDDHSLISIQQAFEFLSKNIALQTRLQHVIDVFVSKRRMANASFVKSESQIQALILPGREQVVAVAKKLKSQGFDVRPILSPTVPDGAERIRICLHEFNSDDEIHNLFSAIDKIPLTL
jgi:8-amino-7-oxononanoate synthase